MRAEALARGVGLLVGGDGFGGAALALAIALALALGARLDELVGGGTDEAGGIGSAIAALLAAAEGVVDGARRSFVEPSELPRKPTNAITHIAAAPIAMTRRRSGGRSGSAFATRGSDPERSVAGVVPASARSASGSAFGAAGRTVVATAASSFIVVFVFA